MSDKPAFTPGPWVVGEIDENGGYDCMTVGVKAGPVTLDAADYGQTRCDDLPHDIKEKMLADANLIAAAPDLYEALLHAKANMPHPDQMIDAALRKARGEAQ